MNYRFYIVALFLWFLTGQPGTGWAQPDNRVMINEDTQYPVIPIEKVQIHGTLEDLGAQDFLQLLRDQGELQQYPNKFSHGFSQHIFWVTFNVQNQTAKVQDLVLEVNNPHIDRVALFLEEDHAVKMLGQGGDRMKFSERTEPYRNFVFRDRLTPGRTACYLLKVDKRNAAVSFPLRLWDKPSFIQQQTWETIIYGGIMVTLAFMTLLSFATGLLLKNRLFLSYGAYVLLVCALIFTALGYSFQYIYPSSTYLNQYTRPVLGLLLTFLMFNFLKDYFRLSTHYPRLCHCLVWGITATSGLMVLWFIVSGMWTDFAQKLIVPCLYLLFSIEIFYFLSSFLMVALLWKKEYPRPLIVAGSFSFPIIAFLLLIFQEFGWVDVYDFLTVNPLVIGGFAEVTVLSGSILVTLTGIVRSRENLQRENHKLIRELSKNALNVIRLKSKEAIQIKDIRYIKSEGHYLFFYLHEEKQPLLDRITMKAVQAQLNDKEFVRIHRSYIVNLSYVHTIYSGHLLLDDGTKLSVTRTYKEQVKEKYQTFQSRS